MKHIFICKKNFWATSFLRGEIQIFVKTGLPKLSFKIGSNFSVILRVLSKPALPLIYLALSCVG